MAWPRSLFPPSNSLSFDAGMEGGRRLLSPSIPLFFKSTAIEIAKVIPVPYADRLGRSSLYKLSKTYVCATVDKSIKRKDSKKVLKYEYRFLNTNRMMKAGVAPKVPIKTIYQNEKYTLGIVS